MMAGPTGSAILDIYGQGMAAQPAERAALLCTAAGGDASRLPIGDVDRAIWSWMHATFSGPMEAVLTCRECGEEIEFTLPDGITLPARRDDDEGLIISHHGRQIAVRLPRLDDLQGGRLALDALAKDAPWDDPEFKAAAQDVLLQADPGMQVELTLDCAACGATQEHLLDVAGFAWERLEQAARQAVHEIAKLARAYGWSETELTAMTPERRAIWLAEINE